MVKYEDTYFFNYEKAYLVAKQQNKMNDGYRLQICYYDGEYKDSDLVNLVHLPIDNLAENLARGQLRFPSFIDFSNTDFSVEVQDIILEGFKENLQIAENLRTKFCQLSLYEAKELSPNFEEPLRFYLEANTNTQVMQHVAKNIADTLKRNGYTVFLKFYYGMEDPRSKKDFVEFNPHVTININHLRNMYLNEKVFNFVWFQDAMPCLIDNSTLLLREKDYIYSLVNTLDIFLKRKGIDFSRQSFCINTNIFYENINIKRDKKIIFIGSSYSHMIPSDSNTKLLVDSVVELFNKGESFTPDIVDQLSEEFNINKDLIRTKIIPYVIRDFSVLLLCQLNTSYTVEIYGHGWEHYESIKPFYHGVLEYGKSLADIYNTATFVFAPHQNYILQQRTLEGAACGAIPILYDCRSVSDEKTYEESICYFKTKNDLEKILLDPKFLKKDLKDLVTNNSYESFTKKILNIVEGKI